MGSCCLAQGAQSGTLWQPRGVGCGRREAQEGGDICIFMLICVVVWQNPTQHCKAIILQLKKNKIKNKSQAYSLRSRISKEVKGDSGTNTLKQKLTFYLYLHQECSYFLISHTHTPAHGHTHIFKTFSTRRAEKAMAPHSSTLAWKIPWMEEPGRLQSMGSLRVGLDCVTSLSLFTFMRWRRKWQPTPVFLPGESQGLGSLVGCRLWGRTESDMTEET